jgi:hypothetical protein
MFSRESRRERRRLSCRSDGLWVGLRGILSFDFRQVKGVIFFPWRPNGLWGQPSSMGCFRGGGVRRTRSSVVVKTCAANRKVAGSIPDEVIFKFT